jgi:signal transduction histidine kinase
MNDLDSSSLSDALGRASAAARVSSKMVLAAIACIALQLMTVALLIATSTRATRFMDRDYAYAGMLEGSWIIPGVALLALMCTTLLLIHLLRLVRSQIAANAETAEALRLADQRIDAQVEARTAELTALSQHLLRTSEEEKSRIARELHGTLGSNLTAINMDLNWIGKRLPDAPELRDRLQRALKMLTDTVEMKHEMIEGLRPSHLDNLGLGFAVRSHCREFTQRTGLPCEVMVQEDFDEIDPAWSIALYRVMQEALVNVARHARAHSVQVRLQREVAGLRLRVLDDGAGIPAEMVTRASSLGLAGMRERMRQVGGSVHFSGNPSNAGTIVDAFIPFEPIAAQLV